MCHTATSKQTMFTYVCFQMDIGWQTNHFLNYLYAIQINDDIIEGKCMYKNTKFSEEFWCWNPEFVDVHGMWNATVFNAHYYVEVE